MMNKRNRINKEILRDQQGLIRDLLDLIDAKKELLELEIDSLTLVRTYEEKEIIEKTISILEKEITSDQLMIDALASRNNRVLRVLNK